VGTRVQLGKLPSGDYGLRVVGPDGTTVIIDGTSDMFRIAATGTLTTESFTGPGSSGFVTVDISTGFIYAPSSHYFVEGSADVSFPLSHYQPGTSGGHVDYWWEGTTQIVNTNQTRARARTSTSISQVISAYVYRYYILEQVGL